MSEWGTWLSSSEDGIELLLLGVLMLVLVPAWLVGSRPVKSHQSGNGILLRPVRSCLYFGIAVTVLFLSNLIEFLFKAENDEPLYLYLLAIVFPCTGILIILDYFVTRYEIGAGGLKYRNVFGNSGIVQWSDVEEVWFAQDSKYFRIRLRKRRALRIPIRLTDLSEIAQSILRFVPAEIIDEKTLQVLDESACGNPSSVD